MQKLIVIKLTTRGELKVPLTGFLFFLTFLKVLEQILEILIFLSLSSQLSLSLCGKSPTHVGKIYDTSYRKIAADLLTSSKFQISLFWNS